MPNDHKSGGNKYELMRYKNIGGSIKLTAGTKLALGRDQMYLGRQIDDNDEHSILRSRSPNFKGSPAI